jgi:hypothetical protein
MKFLCLGCDEQMAFTERQQPGDGTFAASFACPRCGHSVALLANPMETQLVGTLGVKIGGRELDAVPMEQTRSNLAGKEDAFRDEAPSAPDDMPRRPRWSADATERLSHVPGFVRGMVKRIYTAYAVERDIVEITPDVMDRARQELGLEGM